MRQECQSNLKTILSLEPNSQTKLPRFSTMIQLDLIQGDILNRKVKFNLPKSQNFDFPSRDIKDLVDVLNLSPEYDLISR